MSKNYNKRKAYSLLEVSIAMFIIGLLIASGGILFTKISQNQNFKQAELVTLDRQDKIYKAILNYLSENHRLPCPARLNSSYSDSDYGQESRTSGTCNDSDSGWEFRGNDDEDPANYENDARNLGKNNSMEILYGMVPIDVLNLDKDDAEDGYGNKFSYVMIKEFGVKTTSNTSPYGFEYFTGSDRLGENSSTPSVVDYISIKSRESGTNSTLLDKAIMLLISHGENGKGAYIPDSAMQKSIANITNEENKNIHNASYGRVFFTNSDETTTENQEIITFDDHLLFKTKDQLLRDAEMEFVKCGIEQGFINQNYNSQLSELESCLSEDFIPSNNSTYGQTIDITNISNPNTNCGCNDADAILQITCGKYGKWSDIFCNESYKINVVDEVRADSDQGLNLSDDSGTNGIFIADGGNVGILNSNPRQKLSVGADLGSSIGPFFALSAQDGIITGAPNSNSVIGLQNWGSGSKLFSYNYGTGQAVPISIQPDNANVYICQNGGKVGIGLNNPAASLQIDGETSTAGTVVFSSKKSGYTFPSHVHYGGNMDWYIRSGNSSGKVIIQDTGGNVGIGTANPTQKLHVNGNAIVSGSLSKGSGSFDVAHPDPKKKETHRLRHYFVETPSAGGNIYKYQIEFVAGDNYIDLPDYYQYLNKDSLVWVNPVKHFGRAWGEVEENRKVRIVVEKKGIYNILIFGDRKDETAMKDFNKYGIEYKNK